MKRLLSFSGESGLYGAGNGVSRLVMKCLGGRRSSVKKKTTLVMITCVIVAIMLNGCGVLQAVFSPQAAQPSTSTSKSCALTPADMEGPYYIANAPFKDKLYPDGTPEQKLIISGTVYAADCTTPPADAVVDVWQANANGEYDFSDQFVGRGKVKSDANGHYSFETVMPGKYEPRPPHIHFKISHASTSLLTTQLYFAGNDNTGQAGTVIAVTKDGDVSRGTFDIVLGNS
jgi:catechol 1,2-dioxygenase